MGECQKDPICFEGFGFYADWEDTVKKFEKSSDENCFDKIDSAVMLAMQVRHYCEDEAEAGGWYSDLAAYLGESEEDDEF